jgi:hypothetical protein
MPVSLALRRLLRIRELEEEQRRLALESAAAQLNRMKSALAANLDRDRKGRALVAESARTGELPDRLAGVAETRLALRAEDVLTPRIATAELETAGLRQEYLAKRVERRQAETLIRETEARDEVEGGRRAQQALDDWFGNRTRHGAGGTRAGGLEGDSGGKA